MGDADVRRGRAAVVDAEDVVAELGAEDGGELAHGRLEGGVLEGGHHPPRREVAQTSARARPGRPLRRRVLGVPGRHLAEVRARLDRVDEGGDEVVGGEGVLGRRVRLDLDQDVAGVDDLPFPLVEVADDGVEHLLFEEVGAGEVGPVLRDLLLHRRVRLHPGLARRPDFEAEVDVALEEVLVGRHRVPRRRFGAARRPGVAPLELAQRDGAAVVDGHHGRVLAVGGRRRWAGPVLARRREGEGADGEKEKRKVKGHLAHRYTSLGIGERGGSEGRPRGAGQAVRHGPFPSAAPSRTSPDAVPRHPAWPRRCPGRLRDVPL